MRPTALPDPLHLLKRARYRFLKKFLSLALDLLGPLIDKDEIKILLGYEDYNIFRDSSINKMRDSIALKLFSMRSIDILL